MNPGNIDVRRYQTPHPVATSRNVPYLKNSATKSITPNATRVYSPPKGTTRSYLLPYHSDEKKSMSWAVHFYMAEPRNVAHKIKELLV
jgi:hypothetical protein